MRSFLFCAAFALFAGAAGADAQVPDTSFVTVANRLIADGLTSQKAYDWLTELSVGIGPRLSGSPGNAAAVAWGKKRMEELGFDNVRLEPVSVPRWVRGRIEEGTLLLPGGRSVKLSLCALGGSIATPAGGVIGEVVEVKSFDELRALGPKAKGKIVFFNRPMDPRKYSTFEAYGGAVDQRGEGATEAARAGGIAALVRSMTMRNDDVPHTGAMHYADSVGKVPTAALSIHASNLIDSLLAAGVKIRVRLRLSCETLPDAESANVVGELRGSAKPGEVIVIGGHLDSWDKGRGAHDDGAGCAQVIEAARLLKAAGLVPKRTIRVVLFANEENGSRGGREYARRERPGEKHIAALETDAGGFTPRGIGISADSAVFNSIARWSPLLDPIDAGDFTRGGGGTDVGELGRQGVPTLGLRVDSQRYFDYHHSASDTIDKVNSRELELGAIAIAVVSYVIAQEGLP